jgi:hypothetical protein
MEIQNREIKTMWNAAGVKIFEWRGLKNGDVGVPLSWPRFSDRVAEVTGTFGSGGVVELQGSLCADPEQTPTWVIVRDRRHARLIFSAADGADIRNIADNAFFLRPVVTSGDETTTLIVRILVAR